MIYHLHHEGTDLGTAALNELRRRRLAGELSGREFVWCAGMADWQPLDSVLASASPAPSPAGPPPLPTRSRSKAPMIWVSVAILIAVVFATVGAIFVYRTVRSAANDLRDGVGGPVTAAIEPVKVGTNSATEVTVRRQAKAFRQRQWLEGYKERGDRNHPADAEAIRLIERWIEQNYGDRYAIPDTNAPTLVEMANRMETTVGVTDPLLLSVMAQCGSGNAKAELLERALKGFDKSGHRAYPKLNTLLVYLGVIDATDRIDLLQNASAAFQECFRDGSLLPDDQQEVAEIFVHGWGYYFFYRGRQPLVDIVRGAGPEFSWLTQVLQGEFHIIEAWKARGGGFANSVSEQGWKGFKEHLTAARNSFVAAWQARPDLPIAPCRMMSVALGESSAAEMRQWFDRAIAAQIDYPKAWSGMIWGLRPRWHGDLDSMLAFGRVAVETRRFDTDVPRMFFDVVRDIEEELETPPGEHLYGRPDIWPHFETLYEGYIAEPTQERWINGWRRSYGLVAYFAGQYEKAREQFEKLDWKFPNDYVNDWGRELSLMPLEVVARTGPLAQAITAAEVAARKDTALALRQYGELRDSAEADPRTRQFIQHRFAALQLEQRIQSGEWTPLLPSGINDPAWSIIGGNLRGAGTNAVDVISDGYGYMVLCQAQLGPAFEVRGELEFMQPSAGPVGAGFALGSPAWEWSHWYNVQLKRDATNSSQIRFARNWRTGENYELTSPFTLKSGRNTFLFAFRDHRLSATINDRLVMANAEATPSMRIRVDNHKLALMAEGNSAGMIVRYRNLQVRKNK